MDHPTVRRVYYMALVTLAVIRNISMDPMSYVLLPLVKSIT